VNLAGGLALVLCHFLPELLPSLDALPDPRDPRRIGFALGNLLAQALLLPLTQAVSRRQFDLQCRSGNYLPNLGAILGREVGELASADAVNYLLARLAPDALEGLLPELARRLMRMRALDQFRLRGDFLVAFDATETARWTGSPHCQSCLVARHSDGRVDYFHQVLDAKLVASNGLSMSLGFEFIENAGSSYVKQDCELKAFVRLSATVKLRFPQTQICVLGDSLYACSTVIDICVELRWSFFLSFLPGRTPQLYREAEAQLKARPDRSLRAGGGGGSRLYRWTGPLSYKGQMLYAVFIDIIPYGAEPLRLSYLTTHRPDRDNIVELVDEGGRQRAKIEDCFNTQKNRGYGLEHVYGSQGNALKNYYALIQIAHLIHQLMLLTDMLGKLAGLGSGAPMRLRCALLAFRTIRDFAATLAEALRHKIISAPEALRQMASRIQMRFVIGDGS
jgi:hypothetical protein